MVRKLVYSAGISDMPASWVKNNKKIYDRWVHMLARCYSAECKAKQPTYINVTVCEQWLKLSNFASWCASANSLIGHDMWQLDKDILSVNRLQYGPLQCLPVSRHLNNFLTDSAAARGQFPKGVSLYKRLNKYQARIRLGGKLTHIGFYETVEAAEAAYITAKRSAFIDNFSTELKVLYDSGRLMGPSFEFAIRSLIDRLWPVGGA